MSGLYLLAAAIATLYAGPVFAQRDDGMEMQRCVWRCLAGSSGNQDPAYQACVDRVCIPKQRPTSSPARPSVQRQAQSCAQTAGPASAQELVRQCLEVSEAKHSPCRPDNPCSLIVDEISRSCGMKRSAGSEVPTFCDQFVAAGATKPSGIDVESVREIQLQLDALGYEPGPVDGQLGSETRRALQRFQRVSNLPSTGEPTLATTTALRQAYQSLQTGDPAARQAANKAGHPPVPVQAPTAGNRHQWLGTGAASGSSAALVYGVPRTDDVVISFLCDSATKTLTVAYMFEPVGARDGMQVDMELASQSGKVLLKAIGRRLMMDNAFLLEARAKGGVSITEVLAGGRTLSIRVQKSTIAIPLAGAEKGISGLIAACA